MDADFKQREAVFRFLKSTIDILDGARYIKETDDQFPMHYTSQGALGSLIKTGQFRLYDTVGMDDPDEGKYLFERMGIDNHLIRKLTERNEAAASNEMFVGSFVTNSNNKVGDDLMWRTYGGGRKGGALVSKEFSTTSSVDVFGQLVRQEKDGPTLVRMPIAKNELVLYRVYYGNQVIEKALNKLSEQFRLLNFEKLDEKSKSLVRMQLDFVRFIFKKEIYRREEEVRLIVCRRRPEGGASDNPVVKREFSRTFVEVSFRPEAIVLGSQVQNPKACMEWLQSQPWIEGNPDAGEKPIEIRRSDK